MKTSLLKGSILKIFADARNLLARVKKQRSARKHQAAKRRAARARDLARWRAATNCWPSTEDLRYLDEAGGDCDDLRNGEAGFPTKEQNMESEPKAEGERGTSG